MTTRNKLLERLKVQAEHEGVTSNIALLVKVAHILKYSSQWQALVDVRFHKYGKLSYESHRFYYAKPELNQLIELLKVKDGN